MLLECLACTAAGTHVKTSQSKFSFQIAWESATIRNMVPKTALIAKMLLSRMRGDSTTVATTCDAKSGRRVLTQRGMLLGNNDDRH